MEVGKVVKTICYFNADGLVDIVRVKHGYEIVQHATAGDRVFTCLPTLRLLKDASNHASDLYQQGKFA